MDQPSALPTRKVGSGLLAGAIVAIVVWILSIFGVDMPPEVAAAITFILSFLTSYFVQEPGPITTDPTEGGVGT